MSSAQKGSNEQRSGVRTPIVLVVLAGLLAVGGLIYVKSDEIGMGGFSAGGKSFTEICTSIPAGTGAFDAREMLVSSAGEMPGLAKPPMVDVAGREMVVRYLDPTTGNRNWVICDMKLDESGRTVVMARVATAPANN